MEFKITLRDRHAYAWRHTKRGWLREVMYVALGSVFAVAGLAGWGEPGDVPAEVIVGLSGLCAAILVPAAEYGFRFLQAPRVLLEERLEALDDRQIPRDAPAARIDLHEMGPVGRKKKPKPSDPVCSAFPRCPLLRTPGRSPRASMERSFGLIRVKSKTRSLAQGAAFTGCGSSGVIAWARGKIPRWGLR